MKNNLDMPLLNLIINTLHIPIEEDGLNTYLAAVAKKLNLPAEQVRIIKILSKALNLKDTDQFYYTLSLAVAVPDTASINRQKFALYSETEFPKKRTLSSKDRPIIVGFGPAGMFAALELIACGLKPRIFERGKKIEERSIDVETFIRERRLNPESNIQFGEGGAGSYSDGKLFSRRNKNSSVVNQVLKTFVKFGAPPEIEYIMKPHLGTDVLCKIVRNIRLYIIKHGGEIHYSSKMTDILIRKGVAHGIIINNEQEFFSSHIYIALGHSARDSVTMIYKKGVAVEQKQISVGVRIEHPVETINLMRYGQKYHEYSGLGAASYSLNYTNRKIRRGVYTFCMCPGGEVVNASSQEGMLTVNGMSYSDRASSFSNGALVVSCHCRDYGSDHALAGFAFQKEIEQKAFCAGGEDWAVPAQNVMEFLGEKTTGSLNENSCKIGTISADMKELLPGFVIAELVTALGKWRTELPLFVSPQAILLGVETRTSSPVRISRNEHYESINTKNLYPIGEGAGYTGGITSSATDAIKAVWKSQNYPSDSLEGLSKREENKQ